MTIKQNTIQLMNTFKSCFFEKQNNDKIYKVMANKIKKKEERTSL